jgi:hypothetical protein
MKQFRLLTGEQLAALELEKDFQQRVVQLARLNKWKIFAIPDSRRASIAGYPDLTLWNPKQKRIIWVELKREKGKTSPAQDEVIEELRQCGAEVYVWRPSDWNIIAETLAKSRK